MKFPRVVLPFLLVLLALTLSACGDMTATQNFPGLVLQDDLLYLSEGLHVYVVDVVSGQEIRLGEEPLRFPQNSDSNLNLFAPVALTTDGQVIIPNSHPSEHSLYSINPENGAVNWAFQKSKGTWVGGALALNETIYAPGGDGILYALDLRGNERWSVPVAQSALMSHPVSNGELIFLPSMDGFLHAFDPANGREIWQVELGGPALAAPAISEDGTLYIGTLGGELYAIEAASGKITWQQQLDGTIWSTPALQGDDLYLGTLLGREGKFYAITRATGAIRWQRSEAGSIIASPMASDGQVVYVTDVGRVQALSNEGSPIWQADLKGKLVAAPVLAGELILVAPLQGDYLLVAFDSNGAQRWTFKP
jgi:eukaryotic-like serine/threonine-protein kinase